VTVLTAGANETQYLSAAQFERGPAPSAYEPARLLRIRFRADRTNMIRNPSFEVDLVNWVATNATSERAVDVSVEVGGACARLTATVAGVASIETLSGTSGVLVVAGMSYTLSAYVRADASIDAGVRLIFWADDAIGGRTIHHGPLVQVPTGEWTRVSMTAVAPPGARFAQASVDFHGVAVNDVCYADAILMEERAGVRPYFDGSTAPRTALADYLWEGGQPHNARSYLYANRRIKHHRTNALLRSNVPVGSRYQLVYAIPWSDDTGVYGETYSNVY
jgi:hypothetical protein